VLGYVGTLVLLSYNPTSGDTEVLGVSFKLPVFPKTGSHKVMVFSEMHYQRSYKVQDVPRIMPPSDSVAFVAMGAPDLVTQPEMIRVELGYDTLDAYSVLTVPDRISLEYDAGRTAEDFRVNCVMCHGTIMKGDGLVATLMRERQKGPFPADLTAPLTQGSTEGELFAFITWGGRQGSAAVFRGLESRSPMPPFRWLLSEDDRWALVQYVLGQ
jgi:mono/diheme cytochrome c family protein